MKTICNRILIGAPRSQARFAEFQKPETAQRPLPICADCLTIAPAALQFRALGMDAPFVARTHCYICETFSPSAFCSAA